MQEVAPMIKYPMEKPKVIEMGTDYPIGGKDFTTLQNVH